MKTIKLTILLALALILSACSSMAAGQATPTAISTVTAPNIVIAQGRLEPTRFTEIALNASGLVSEVKAKEGDPVTAGQVIAIVKSSEAQTLEEAQTKASQQLTTAYQKLRDTQIKLDNFDVPSDFKGKTPTEALASTLDKLNIARNKFEPYRFIWDPRWGNLNLDDPKNYKIVARNANRDALVNVSQGGSVDGP
jgi:multidrug efflux pump subunit AcrA (membrane-fusion protein)